MNSNYDTLGAAPLEPHYLEKIMIRKNDGNPIHADLDAEVWKELRQSSIGASDAMKLIKQNGEKRTSFAILLAQKQSGEDDEHYWSFDHGIQREPLIAQWIQINLPHYDLVPNRFVYGGDDIRHTATPDMVGPNHIAEIKTSTKPLRQTLSRYYDQLQWQMHVTNYQSVLFVVENRNTQEIEHELVERDIDRIKLLVDAANELLELL
jgi:predicted phage-related endonuclease